MSDDGPNFLDAIRSYRQKLIKSSNVDKIVDLQPAHFMDSISEIMRALRAARALLGLSQEELAELAGISRQIVVRIEKGEKNVLVDVIERVRAVLESHGVAFIDATREHGPGVAMARRRSAVDKLSVDRQAAELVLLGRPREWDERETRASSEDSTITATMKGYPTSSPSFEEE